MPDEDAIAKDEGGGDMGVIILMLGLYLIVLAFFILLNAISESSPVKEELVMESVKKGFDFREEGQGKGSDPTDISAPPKYEAMVQTIDGMVQSYLQVGEYDLDGDPNNVQLRLDIDRFFYKGEVRIIPDMILFFEDIADMIESRKFGTHVNSVKTQVIISGDESTTTDKTPFDAFTLAGLRSTLFVRALIDEGVNPLTISAGSTKGIPSIFITFYLYEDAGKKEETTTSKGIEELHEVMRSIGATPNE